MSWLDGDCFFLGSSLSLLGWVFALLLSLARFHLQIMSWTIIKGYLINIEDMVLFLYIIIFCMMLI
jgi:hypothetical protein